MALEERNICNEGAAGDVDAEAVIIGGGISGMCMAIKLLEAGIQRIVIVEKSAGFGGTWRDNRYPGCRCDIPAHLYCFSFAGNPDWSRVFPDQTEILAYLTKIAAKYELYSYVRFSSTVNGAEWNESENKWKVSVQVVGGKDAEFGSSYTISTDFLVSAVGQLNAPSIPIIPGLGDYKGKLVHSARWSMTDALLNKRVAIIGNGATAIQIVPELAKSAAQLTLIQRTPNWVMPRDDEIYPKKTKMILDKIPLARHYYRSKLMDRSEGFHAPLTQLDTEASDKLRQWCLGHMHAQLPGREDLWDILTPTYTPGCKRILISNDFYPSLLQDNVEVETRAIKRVTDKGIEFSDGTESEYDCIILATGFLTGDLLQSLPIKGLGGRTIQDIWKKDGVRAMYGIAVEDLPNFGMLYGPNTNLAHNSIILMIEAQSRYIEVLVSAVVNAQRQGQKLAITPKKRRVAEFNDALQLRLLKTSFADSKCQSWYKTEEGKVTNNWYGTVVQYQEELSIVRWSDYDLSGPNLEIYGTEKKIGRVVEESNVVAWKAAALCGAGAFTFVLATFFML